MDEISIDFSDQGDQTVWLHLGDDEDEGGRWMSATRASFIAGLLTAAVKAIDDKEDRDAS